MITAEEAGGALSVIAQRLLDHGVVKHDGHRELQRLGSELRKQKEVTSWKLAVDRGNPIVFDKAYDKNGDPISLRIVCDGIDVSQEEDYQIPFRKLDIAIEVNDELNIPVARWHLDLANKKEDGSYQSGPLVHLQYGGHHAGHRHLDHKLQTPRWCHPPMEIGLLCEVVSANFFEEKWLDFREDRNWCEAISSLERLCFTKYLAKLQACGNISSKTTLSETWASTWK